jgi:hypothetical protein
MAEGDSAGATRLDDETMAYLRAAVAREHGLTEAQSRRLVGSTLKTLHADASVMATELGVDDPHESGQARDDGGRFARATAGDMNTIIRAASGRS